MVLEGRKSWAYFQLEIIECYRAYPETIGIDSKLAVQSIKRLAVSSGTGMIMVPSFFAIIAIRERKSLERLALGRDLVKFEGNAVISDFTSRQ